MAFMNTPIELEMLDGSIRLSLRMRSLYVVWRKWPSLWSEFSRIANSEAKTAYDVCVTLYIAYLCECIDTNVPPRYGSYAEFSDAMPEDADTIVAAFEGVFMGGLEDTFRREFEKRTFSSDSGVKMPPLKLRSPDDYFALYVCIMGMSEDAFWNMEFSFMAAIASSKASFEAWRASELKRGN